MTNTTLTKTGGLPWWREPMMWLVVGGPLAVVVASVVTLVLAIRHPDPVLEQELAKQEGESVADLRSEPTRPAALPASLRPAMQARNHAATGGQ